MSFTVGRSETFALVGESGSGKSTVGRVLLRLTEQTAGSIVFDGEEIGRLSERQARRFRHRIQMLFQDPMAAFDPRMTIRESLAEFLRLRGVPRSAVNSEVARALASVGLDSDLARRRPGALSGGQLQRVGVARALAPEPELVFLDEPTSALDVSIRGQIVNLLSELQETQSVGYVLVTHDLRVVEAMADRVGVMYLGQLVEVCAKEELFERPLHPYTRALIGVTRRSAIAEGAADHAVGLGRLHGELSLEHAEREGCRLAPRCPFAEARCEEPQELVQVAPAHWARCWKALDVEQQVDADATKGS
ncbi:ABC transporter ATP-binding protein [Egibacter rhizosphaerae]|uniref:ABC transporter ATP-binding protein n=1 Tax=Egibacter rhizosphaerae TaxID=1670831 RepID=UPI0013F14382|nr:ABC transporter ATP-binding protein [Egibacter rhizosphaerae]